MMGLGSVPMIMVLKEVVLGYITEQLKFQTNTKIEL